MSSWSFGPDWEAHDVVLSALCVAGLLAVLLCVRLLRRAARQRSALAASLEEARTALGRRGEPAGRAATLSRRDFDRALDAAVEQADHHGEGFCLIYLDLDNFSAVNDACGHDRGDELLREVGREIVRCAGKRSCHVAGDEFAIIVQGGLETACRAAERLAKALARPLRDGAPASGLSCSIGIAQYPDHGARPVLMANAVLAMRSVKMAGGGAQATYDPQLGVNVREQASLVQDLRLALERRQFELYYQPKIDAGSLQVTAAEALLRWRHPQRGMVSPAIFIPLAERYGLIGPIGQWVLEEACRQAAQWREKGLRMRVAINLSGYQMRQDDMVERIEAALRRHRIPPGRLTCEITESVAMEDSSATRVAFERLRAAGIHVSIDDFGTGYSSLASLRKLPAAELKVDRAFVCDLDTSPDALSIVRAVVQMAHSLGLRVVAEGVETQAQRDLLVREGCDELQGYLFAKPMTAQALELWATDEGPAGSRDFRPSLFTETQPVDLAPR